MLFDASSILALVRDLKGKAPDILFRGSTIYLAYYDMGNALWRECFLLKRMNGEEVQKLLRLMFAILQAMDFLELNDEDTGSNVLDLAGKLHLTYYDTAYLGTAQMSSKVLVKDDARLAKAAERASVKVLTSRAVFGR